MEKLLFISNIAIRVGAFSVASIAAAKKCGMDFYYAANWNQVTQEQRMEDEEKFGIKLVHIDLNRSPYSIQNLKAYRQLVDFIKKEHIDYIHCNTPVGGLLGRIVGEKCKVKKVLYQVHGFHFYDGAPKKNWILYYPVEKWLAKKTDVIITINKEDFKRANSFKLRNNGNVYYVPGVGIDLTQYNTLSENTRIEKRLELGLEKKDIAIISVGELNKNKNNQVIIEALASLQNENIKYFLCGVGNLEKNLQDLVKEKQLENQVYFLGYRTDIKELLMAADVFVMPSLREGLSRSIMEAMACGLPCIVSKIRGNVDLIDSQGGFLCDPLSTEMFANALLLLTKSAEVRDSMGRYNLKKIKCFDLISVTNTINNIYSNCLDGDF